MSDPALVPSAVAGVLGLKLGGDEISPEAVARAIGERQLLLVIDNCEHVIDAVASFVEALIRLCPRTVVLATSREVIQIDGEYVYRVPALDVPLPHQAGSDDILGHSAVQLFIARTTSLDSDFSPDAASLAAIASICRRLDGIPLAIEFAAARAASLGLHQVALRLEDRFGLLTGGRRTALARHQTLRATLDWSYELLPEPEQWLLRRLAIFAAGFTLDAATAIMDGSAPAVAEGVANLVAKSLVTLDRSAPGSRWMLLDTIRAYALEKLAASGEAAQTARRHAQFYRTLFAPGNGSQLQPPIDRIVRYAREIDNVRAALDWSFSPSGDPAIGAILTAAYVPVWLHLSLMAECHERTQQALAHAARAADPAADLNLGVALQMQLYLGLGLSVTYSAGSVERAETALARAREIAERLDDVDTQLRILWAQCSILFRGGNCHDAQTTAEQFFHIAQRTGHEADVLVGERLIGNTLHFRGMLAAARQRLDRALELYDGSKNQRHLVLFQYDQRALAKAMLARVLWLQGHLDQANAQAQAALEAARTTNHVPSICSAIDYGVCIVASMSGDLVTADRAVTMLVDLSTSINAAFWKILGRCLKGQLLIARGELEAGTALLCAERDASETSGWSTFASEYMGALAEGFAGLGRHDEAAATVDQALARTQRGGEHWYLAELLRLKGELTLQQGTADSRAVAEAYFQQALDVAREQGALFWELRAALSAARAMAAQDRHDDARQILAPVYARFTEGFAAADMRAARALLEAPPHRPYSGGM